ncbi:MAG: class II aldolase/adducin family protein [Thermodesulfobacteriota bacterium]
MQKETEAGLRNEVAACCRIAEYLDLFDFSGHVSARINGTDTFLINARDSVRSSIGLNDIVEVDFNGKSLEPGKNPPSEIYIHSEIYKRRTDVFSVAHLHSRAMIELSIANKAYVPVNNRGSYFADGIPVYDHCHNIKTAERGSNLAITLGRHRAVIIRGHGSVVVGENVKAVLFGAHFCELNASYQIGAYRMGVEPRALTEDERAEYTRFWGQRIYEKVWNYYFEKANAGGDSSPNRLSVR